MNTRHVLSLSLLLAAAGVGAQTLKPGLWEVTHKSHMRGGPNQDDAMAKMNQQLASMPPEQRKKVEAMMAKNGASMAAAPGGGMVVKVCMTKEMVERQEFPSQQGHCQTTRQSRSGNTLKMAFACTDPPSSGEGQMTFVSSEAYTNKMTVTSTAAGKPRTMDMEGSGKWLGADCGSIKPIAPPKK